ncbi:hypothetical protein PTKIN_Ptkin10aG0059300 [Pterospermum kingtungense]
MEMNSRSLRSKPYGYGLSQNQARWNLHEQTGDIWRRSLFSVFVSNISWRIPKSALWEALNQYGRVMDVYIQPRGIKALLLGLLGTSLKRNVGKRWNLEIGGRWMDGS